MIDIILEREATLAVQKEQELDQLHNLKYENEPQKETQAQISITVYVDSQSQKKYIDIFAAASLEIVPFDAVETYYDSGLVLCEISEEKLLELRRRFEDRIEYIDLSTIKDMNFVNIPDTNVNKQDEKEKNVLGNYVKKCFGDYKKNEQYDDFSNYLQKVENIDLGLNTDKSL